MTDETTPKRRRGLKEREAAFRAGFEAGLKAGESCIGIRGDAERKVHEQREYALEAGLVKLGAEPVAKRTRRTKAKPVTGTPAEGPFTNGL